MLTVKEILAKIKETLGADAPAEITTLLADADRQLIDMAEAMSAANRESADRKKQIKELTEKVTGLESDLAKKDTPEAKAEIAELRKVKEAHEALLTAKAAETLASWTEKAKLLSIDKTDKRYDKVEKIKGKFIMPTEGQELTPDQLAKNIETYDLLTEAGYFAVETQEAGGRSPLPTNTQAPATRAEAYAAVIQRK